MSRYLSDHKGIQGTMDIVHKEIHDGEFYEASAIETIAGTTSWSLVYIEPSVEAHMEATLDSDEGGVFRLHRTPVLSSTAGASTGKRILGRNHDDARSTKGSTRVKCTLTPTLALEGSGVAPGFDPSAFGTTMETKLMPVGGSKKITIGGQTGQRQEWILASSNTYALYFSPSTTGANVGWSVTWYEA